MQACTIIATNYAPFARVLARTFRRHHPESRFSAFLIDDWRGRLDPSQEPFELIGPAELEMPEFPAMARRYDIVELATAVKPWVMRYLLSRDGEPTLYLDPDIRVFGPLDEIAPLAGRHGVVLLPHLTQPIPRDGRRPSEIDILAAGAYNLGFLGLAPHRQSDTLLSWWAERLETDCRIDPGRSLFVDQRWIDLVPGMHDVAILRDPGYDVAYWNLHYRRISGVDGKYQVNGRPLRFMHFSGYDPDTPGRLSKHQNRIKLRREPVLAALCEQYRAELLAAGYGELHRWAHQPSAVRPRQPAPVGAGTRAATAPRPAPSIPLDAPVPARRRSLGQRIVDLEHLVEGSRRNGDGPAGVARSVLREIGPFARLRPRPGGPSSVPPPPMATATADRHGVNVVGYLTSEVGVGEIGRQALAALQAGGIPAVAVAETAHAYQNRLRFRSVPSVQAHHSVNLVCVNADMLPEVRRRLGEEFFGRRHTVGVWFWEVGPFPDRFWDAFDLIDEIWACSEHMAQIFEACSRRPVHRIRIPVVPGHVEDPAAGDLPMPDGFTFLFMFDHLSVFERKNPLGVIEAFSDAFPPGSGASLIIKCINGDQRPRDHELLVADADRHPDVHVFDGYMSAAEKNAMLARCDCYVSLHRAEGFGLTMAEAMYFARPVIATGYSGNLEFMTPENSRLVQYEVVPVGPGNEPYPDDASWAEPDLAHAARYMRELFEDATSARNLGARAARDIRRTHSAAAAGRSMRRRLEAIFERADADTSRTGS